MIVQLHLEGKEAALMLADELSVQVYARVVRDAREAKHDTLAHGELGHSDIALVENPAVVIAEFDALLEVVVGGGDGHRGSVFERALVPRLLETGAVVELEIPDAAEVFDEAR